MTLDDFILSTEARLGITHTQEQRDFYSDFTSPLISFSSPGTGKTRSAVMGLLTTEFYHKIPGDQIYALSFTNMATIEFANRHKEACNKLGKSQDINFSTLHSLCSKILKENYALLGMSKLTVTASTPIAALVDMLVQWGEDNHVSVTKYNARNIIYAVRSLNSSLVFDPRYVESTYAFKKCRITYDEFTAIREVLYSRNKLIDSIPVDDIMLYTLELLLSHPEVSEAFKSKCRVLVIDEFQDLSLLQLRIISLLSDCVIAIGDIKQQIYAFNGACQDIVEQYYKYFPNARRADLTRSFRCKDKIAEYATSLILFNGTGGEDFKGTGPGGEVSIQYDIPLSTICEGLKKEYTENLNKFKKSTMFLFRNNFSAIPIVEELYKVQLPMRADKYVAANRIPIISELCEVIELALHPEMLNNFAALRYLGAEYVRYSNYRDIPVYHICQKTGESLLSPNVSIDPAIKSLLGKVAGMVNGNAKLSDVFNTIWPRYSSVFLSERRYYYEYEPEYYIGLVASITRAKTYQQFIHDEIEKEKLLREYSALQEGVRCYTFHSSKGLEADCVYIVDAESDIIPNMAKLDKMETAGCPLEKAREIRNERSLVYVACTRAKSELHIFCHNISMLMTGLNFFSQYDEIYKTKVKYEDVLYFEKFCGIQSKEVSADEDRAPWD